MTHRSPWQAWWLLLLLVLSFGPTRAQEADPLRYAKFPGPAPDLLFSLFQTTYAYPTDAEDLYPVILLLTRGGVPVWSQLATVDPALPFLSIECKVAWSPDGKWCACSYRTSRSSTSALALDFTEGRAKPQTLAVDDLQDSVLETRGDTKGKLPVSVRTEALEIGNDGLVRLSLSIARTQTHQITALFDGKTSALRSWEPAKPAAK